MKIDWKKIDVRKIDFKKIGSNAKDIYNTKIKTSYNDYVDHLQNGGKPLVWTVIITFLVMVIVCLAVFFASVKGAEKVMVPNVVGKDLETALLEMQAKELYPKIQLKYSDIPGDEGTILNQNPHAGAIVKAYRRITLTVSRGAVVDTVENYIGQTYDDVRVKVQTQFTGQKQLIVLAEPVYKADKSDPGTILEQNPPAGTSIVDPVTVQLVVSRGETYEQTTLPNIVGKNVDAVLEIMAANKVVFDFTSHVAADGEKVGTVVREQKFTTDTVPNYQRVTADFAFPAKQDKDKVYGLFTKELADYPYAVAVRLDATDADGMTTTLISFNHTGKNLTIPYAVPAGTILTLYVVNKETARFTVE